ncbi:hypothetical protein [Maledivibacter halophilus]|uniref:Uncharacterized protein n=1 Tax=Maledivibacter halophilus TaxID=36842 RepID=A0A1T5MT56_9FIRM|nr:hypothetical protein [Maledivibacter halophilus]SKC91395.1 hypothetical protein SAMN02194393_05310 [Maledivibacter halophilus]
MDKGKDISEKIFETANNISKKGDSILKIGEYKINIKLIQKEIRRKKLYLGDLIYKWSQKNEVEMNAITTICNEIKDLEIEIEEINKEILKIKENN